MATRNGATRGFSPGADIGVGMLGYGYMGRVHSRAYRLLAEGDASLRPRLVAIGGRTEEKLAAAATEYGFERHETDWRAIVADPAVGLVDNGAPNDMHADPTAVAAEAGRHVLCEKPLGRTAEESFETWRRVAAAGVVHMCAFNYRFVPALRRARDLVRAGEIGDVLHVRARYLQEWLVDPEFPVDWRLRRETAGAGAVADLGVHAIDLVRFLAGEPVAVSASVRRFTDERPGGRVDVDDAFAATVELASGAIGTLEASRVARGRGDDLRIEVNGTHGAVAFALGRPEELRIATREGEGFQTEIVRAADGEPVRWADTFVHELRHLLAAIAGEVTVAPDGATFRDGYRADEVGAAILRSAASGRREPVTYRELPSG